MLDLTLVTTAEKAAHIALCQLYNSEYKLSLKEYKKQQAAIKKVRTFVSDSIALNNFLSVKADSDLSLWKRLYDLKNRFALSDFARKLELEQFYQQLSKGLSYRQDPEMWLNKFKQMLAKAKAEKIAEVSDAGQPYRDFLLAIKSTAPILATMLQQEMRTLKEKDMKKTIIISIKDYWEEMKVLKAQDKPGNSAFLTDKEDKTTEDKPSFHGKQQQQPKEKQ